MLTKPFLKKRVPLRDRIDVLEGKVNDLLAVHNQTIVRLGDIHEMMVDLKRHGCGKARKK